MKSTVHTKKSTASAKKQPTTTPGGSIPLLRGLVVGAIAALVILVIWAGGFGSKNSANPPPQVIAGVPTQDQNAVAVPPAVSTVQPTVPPSPTRQVPPPTPTVKIWPTPFPIQGVTYSPMNISSEVGVGQKSTVNSTQPISQFIWAPTGDKILYLTKSGDLYWSNPDGSSATFLLHYDEMTYDQLGEQMPMSDTLLIRHLGGLQADGERAPSHLDVVKFTPGQPPTLQQGPDLPHAPIQLRWWSSTRASGFAHTGYDGGDLLVTVDQDGHLVDEVNVPYMISGAVRPGGAWLAYSTTYQVTDPIDGTTPQTTYLLNLSTGQRIQVGIGGVGSWSPDGNWFLISSPDVGLALVSADGHQWITVPDPTASIDAVWSPDSKYLAYAYVDGESPNGYTITSWVGAVHIVNVPARKVTNISSGFGPKVGASSTLMWQPKWSRDGSVVSFLSFDPNCPFECSQLTPAIFNMVPIQ